MKIRTCMGVLLVVLALVLTACGGSNTATSAPAGSVTVNVIETEYSISSSLTTFKPGQPYHFVVANNGSVAHEFMIMPKDEGDLSGKSMSDMDKVAMAMLDNLNPGDIKSLDYTFPASTANTHPQFSCYLPGHYGAGMKEDVTVQSQ